jgi:anthranilate synthase component I
MSRVMRVTKPCADAFALYTKAVRIFGKYQAFLLDSRNGPIKTPYEMSLLGVLPFIEIQVKSKVVFMQAEKHVAAYLYDQLRVFDPRYVASDIRHEFCGEAGKEIVLYSSFEIHHSDPMDILEKIRTLLRERVSLTDETHFSCGFLGYFGYDAIHYLETLPSSVTDDRNLPDIRFQFHPIVVQLKNGNLVMFNHLDEFSSILPQGTLACFNRLARQFEEYLIHDDIQIDELFYKSIRHESLSGNVEVTEDVPESVFKKRVNRAKEYILSGDVFQVVISKRVRVRKVVHPYLAYARLRQENPSPYMFMAEYPDMRLFGASPEVQFRAVGNHAQMKPIAGTSKGRGPTSVEDEQFRSKLVNNAKDKAEHLMLVDLCRNDLGRVCQPGTVKVDDLMTIEAYTNLFHLVSTVNGVLREGANIFRALLSTFPAGTLSGAPKIRAMEIIDELEDFARGPYGGFVGMVDIFGNANTAIIIRSVVEKEDVYYVQAGAGIVADSDADEEWQECGRKARAILHVLTDSSKTISN